MSTYEIDAVLDLTASILLRELHKAHWRYLNIAGIISETIPRDRTIKDPKRYLRPVKCDANLVGENAEGCVEFMAEVTGFPPSFCEAWMKYDYYDELKYEIQ